MLTNYSLTERDVRACTLKMAVLLNAKLEKYGITLCDFDVHAGVRAIRKTGKEIGVSFEEHYTDEGDLTHIRVITTDDSSLILLEVDDDITGVYRDIFRTQRLIEFNQQIEATSDKVLSEYKETVKQAGGANPVTREVNQWLTKSGYNMSLDCIDSKGESCYTTTVKGQRQLRHVATYSPLYSKEGDCVLAIDFGGDTLLIPVSTEAAKYL